MNPLKSRSESVSEKKDIKKDGDKRVIKVPNKVDKKELDSTVVPSSPILLSPRSEPIKTLDIAFNTYEKQFQDKSHLKDACSDLILWPKDDVIVEEQKRKTRTGTPVLPVCS